MFKIKDRELVLPGQLLGEDISAGECCFKENKNVFSSVRGLARINRNTAKVIPFNGKYAPKKGDVVIGVIGETTAGGWFVNINSGYRGYMRGEETTRNPMQEDLSRYYDVGERFTAIVGYVNEIYKCNLIKPWKIRGGMIIDVSPKKVPRIIGKNKSMINMLRDKTECKIIVGQNGRLWLNSDNIDNLNFAIGIIRKIEAESHISGLTDKIGNLIDKELNKQD